MRALSQLQGLPINGPGSRARKVDISSPYAWAAAVLLCSGLVCGVSAATTHPNNCTANCSHQSNASMRSESSLHVSNMKVCGSNQICRATETTRHGQAMRSIQAERDACQDQCPRP